MGQFRNCFDVLSDVFPYVTVAARTGFSQNAILINQFDSHPIKLHLTSVLKLGVTGQKVLSDAFVKLQKFVGIPCVF